MRAVGNAFFDGRNRLLARPAFRRIAQKLPFFQWIARRQARQLFRLCSGFIHSQVLLACVRLELFERLQGGALSLHAIAAETGLPDERLRQLLNAAAALKLLERRPRDCYGLGMLGASMSNNESLDALVRHHALLYEDLSDPVRLVQNESAPTRVSKLWPYASAGDPRELPSRDVAAYTDLMAGSQVMIAEQVLDALSLRHHGSLLDLGGGAGAFVTAAANRWPHLQLTLAELPGVAAIARERLAAAGLERRVRVVEVDAEHDTLAAEHDVVSLLRVLHDHDDDAVLRLLANAKAALRPGGILLVVEPIAGRDQPGRLIDAYFSVYLLAMGSGRPRRFTELRALLERAGFRHVQQHRTRLPLITSVISARADS